MSIECPKTAPEIIDQLCGTHYYPGIGKTCAMSVTCNNHFKRWMETEPEVQRIHKEWEEKSDNA